MKNKFYFIFVFLASLILSVSGAGAKNNNKGRPFTLVVLPDTQHYYDVLGHPRGYLFGMQIQWILDHLIDRNIRFVIHLGDIVQTGAKNEWENAAYFIRNLDGVVPYAVTVGNHEVAFRLPAYVRNNKNFNKYFPVERYSGLPSFGGVFEPGKLENSYHYFSAGGMDYLVIGLEYLPRDEVLSWANRIVEKHPDHRVIFFTHSYIHHNNDYAGPDSDPKLGRKLEKEAFDGNGNLGKDIWLKFVRRHKNIFLTLNGHIIFNDSKGKDGVGRRISNGMHGNKVFQIGSNYQQLENGGNGFMRLMEFSPDGDRAVVSTYSPFLDDFKTDPKNSFTIDFKNGSFKKRD